MAPGNDHGFIPAHSKTDNFKVKGANREIDTQFFDVNTGVEIDGKKITWIDTLGGSNIKWSYTNPAINLYHFAHVEAVEDGTHNIVIADQTGCRVVYIAVFGTSGKTKYLNGAQTVGIYVNPSFKSGTITLYVACATQ